MNPMRDEKLSEWSSALAAEHERAHELIGALSREQLNFRHAPKKWSVGQCIDHVSVAMGVYLDRMEPVVEQADKEGGEPYGRGTWMGRFLIRALRKPGKRYMAPPSFRPRGGELEPDDVRDELDRQFGRMRRALERSDGLALGEILMPWPVFRPVKLSLAQAVELQILHVGRHLDQAQGVIRKDGFPWTGDPVERALLCAPFDDEPDTDDFDGGLTESRRSMARGEGITTEALKRELGID